jgi:hypothetical protein
MAALTAVLVTPSQPPVTNRLPAYTVPAGAEAMQLAGRESLRLPNLWHPPVEPSNPDSAYLLKFLYVFLFLHPAHVFQIHNRHRQSWTSESTCVYCCEFSQGRGVCCTGRGGSSRNLREPNNPKSLLKSQRLYVSMYVG